MKQHLKWALSDPPSQFNPKSTSKWGVVIVTMVVFSKLLSLLVSLCNFPDARISTSVTRPLATSAIPTEIALTQPAHTRARASRDLRGTERKNAKMSTNATQNPATNWPPVKTSLVTLCFLVSFLVFLIFICIYFYSITVKGYVRGSVRLSVRPFIGPFVCPFVSPFVYSSFLL